MILLLLSSCFRLNWTREIMCFDTVTDGSTDIVNATITFAGEDPDDMAGFAVATGDIDGNGFSDVLVSAPGNDSGGTNAGKVYLILDSNFSELGKARTALKLVDVGLEITGDESEAFTGYSLFFDDIDGDQLDDIVIGAPLQDNGTIDSGAVYVFLASSLSSSLDSLESAGTADADYIITGENAGDTLGKSLSVGDVDGDGMGDLLIGADGSTGDEGRAYLFLGSSLTALDAGREIDASHANYTFLEGNGGGRLGTSVSNAHDFNKDGLADILIGIPNSSENGITNAGKISLMLSSSLDSQVSEDGDVVLTHAEYSLYGENENDGLGSFVYLAATSFEDGVMFIGTGEEAQEKKLYMVWASNLSDEGDDTIPYAEVFPASKVALAGNGQTVLLGGENGAAIGDYFAEAYSEDSVYLFNSAQTEEPFLPVPVFADFNNDGLDEVIIGNPQGLSNDEMVGEVYVFVNCDYPLK